MAFCTDCGDELPKNAYHCIQCGEPTGIGSGVSTIPLSTNKAYDPTDNTYDDGERDPKLWEDRGSDKSAPGSMNRWFAVYG